VCLSTLSFLFEEGKEGEIVLLSTCRGFWFFLNQLNSAQHDLVTGI
jgi:hypothetical protein